MPLTIDAILAGAEAGQKILIAESRRRSLLERHAGERGSIENELREIEKRRAELLAQQHSANDRQERERDASSQELQAASEAIAKLMQTGAAASGMTPAAVSEVFEKQRQILEQAGVYGALETDIAPSQTVIAERTPDRAPVASPQPEPSRTPRRGRRLTTELPTEAEDAPNAIPSTPSPEPSSEDRHVASQGIAEVSVENPSDVTGPSHVETHNGGSTATNASAAALALTAQEHTTDEPDGQAEEIEELEPLTPSEDLALAPATVEVVSTPGNTGSDGAAPEPTPTSSRADPADWFKGITRIATEREPDREPDPEMIDETPTFGTSGSSQGTSSTLLESPSDTPQEDSTGMASDGAGTATAGTGEAAAVDPFDELSRQFGGPASVPFEIPESLKR